MPSQFLIALKCNFRFDVAQRPAAAICTGFLNDLIAAGYMPSNSSNLAVDGKKMYSVVQITSDRFGEICKFRSRGSLALLSLGVGIDQ